MAKEKFLTPEEFQNSFKSEEKLVFSTSFPFEDLTTPPKTLWTMWHWSISGSTGTAYVVRAGLGAPIKVDAYSLQNKGDEFPIVHVNPRDLGYHHIFSIEELPLFVMEEAPTEFIDKAKGVLEKWESNKPPKKLGE